MRDPNQILPDIKRHLEKRAKEIIKKDFPEVKVFSATCDIKNKVMSFQGLTPEQEAHVLGILFEKN